jgi:hypothetical protein
LAGLNEVVQRLPDGWIRHAAGRRDPADRPASAAQVLALLAAALPADAAEEDRLWPAWATGRLAGWQASTMARPPLAPRPA